MCIILKLLVILHFLVPMQIEAQRKIFLGEQVASIKDIPFIVRVTVFKGELIPGARVKASGCGGCYIRPNWVISATHCIQTHLPLKNNKPKFEIHLCMGEIEPATCPENHLRHADKLYPHTDGIPDFHSHDILLIHVAKPWDLGPTIRIAKLQRARVNIKNWVGKQCLIAGWGNINLKESAKILKKAMVVVDQIRPDTCGILNDSQLCVKYQTGVGCHGDSGGPLVLDNTLIGIFQGGTAACNTSDKRSVYNLIQGYKEWIVRIAGPDPDGPPDGPAQGTSIFPNISCLSIIFIISFFNFILN